MYIKGKTAIITGISRGIGKALAQQLLSEACTVIGWGRTAPDYSHENLHFISCDISNSKAVEKALEESLHISPQINFLVNNAGFGYFSPLEDFSEEKWHEMFAVNVHGAFLVSKAVTPTMKQQGSGHIINISSIAGRSGMAQGEGYNATKFALRGFSEAIFFELRSFGIKVTTVYPGSTRTNFFDDIPAIQPHDNMMAPEEVARSIIQAMDTSPNYVIREIEMRPLIARPKG